MIINSLANCRGVTRNGPASRTGRVEILLATSFYKNWDKLWQLWASQLQGFSQHNEKWIKHKIMNWHDDHKCKWYLQQHGAIRTNVSAASLLLAFQSLSLKCLWSKKKCYLFKRLSKVKKNGPFLFGISLNVLDIFVFLYYANEESDDVIVGSTRQVQHLIKNIAENK